MVGVAYVKALEEFFLQVWWKNVDRNVDPVIDAALIVKIVFASYLVQELLLLQFLHVLQISYVVILCMMMGSKGEICGCRRFRD